MASTTNVLESILGLRRLRPFVAMRAALVWGLAWVDPGAAAENVVEMDQLRVGASTLGRPYFYVSIPGFEFLSPFSEKETKAYVREFQRQRAVLTELMPELGRNHCDTPYAVVLDDQPPPLPSPVLVGASSVFPESILRQSLDAMRGAPPSRRRLGPEEARTSLTWCRAASADSVVFYTNVYGHEPYARQVGTTITTGNRAWSHLVPLAALFEHRRPKWPSWLEFGIDALAARFLAQASLQIFPPQQLNAPPPELSLSGTFAQAAGRMRPDQEAWNDECASVLVSWAFSGAPYRREQFWRFATAASRQPLGDDLFEYYFGQNAWDDVRAFWMRTYQAQLNHRASTRPLLTYLPERAPSFADPIVRRATRAELTRIRCEYE